MLTDHHLSDVARQRILLEVAKKCREVVYNVLYSW
jgi:hypothetical protein